MMNDLYQEKTKAIIIDFGLKYTKVGFAQESEPRKILQTPQLFNLNSYFADKVKNANIFLHQSDTIEAKLKIEEFIYYVVHFVLQLKKELREKNYTCVLLIDYGTVGKFRIIYEYLASCLLNYSVISKINVASKHIFPVFTTGFASGLILHCGYTHSTITVVNNGVSIFNKEIPIGSSLLAKQYKEAIIADTKALDNISQVEMKDFSNALDNYMDDIFVRTALIVSKKLSYEIASNDKKIKGSNDYTKVIGYNDIKDFKISFANRIFIGEGLFDDIKGINLAYEVLYVLNNNTPCEIKRKIASNIILSGGMTMLFGFFRRFNEEIMYLLNNDKEFNLLGVMKDIVKVHKIIFPRNCLAWIGASLFMNFNSTNISEREIMKDDNDIIQGNISDLFKDI